ncbi:MAG TPA: hypothetical protein VLW45_06515 [Pelomicrobium sp.]|nr:hypothetical protein [Pelomicrobium sp.]
MICHLVVPHLSGFPCDADLFAGLELPALARLLSRGDPAAAPARSLNEWLLEAYAVPRQLDLPVAPLTLRLDGGAPDGDYWLRADPIHFRVDRDRVTLADAGAFVLAEAEAAALTDALNRHFSGEGLAFVAPGPARWYLRADPAPDLVTRPLPEAVGGAAADAIANGADAARWRRLQTEMQMVLHEHPVNAAREAGGTPPVNGVWLWGGGRDPAPTARRFGTVAANDALARALAQRTDAFLGDAATAETWLASATGDEGLAVLDQLTGAAQYGDGYGFREALAALERDWFAPLTRALETGRIARLVLYPLPQPRRVEVTPSALRKFWRRVKPLSALAAVSP